MVSVLPTVAVAADSMELPDGSKLHLTEKCPVCEMIIGGKERQPVSLSYKDGRVVGFHGVAAAVFKDGRVVGFEGARCLFIYNSVPQKYDIEVANIRRQFVTDFLSKKMIDLSKAFLVLGSNVKGPMGYELVPFATKDEAVRFATENDGKWIVQLHEVLKREEDRQEGQQLGTSGNESSGGESDKQRGTAQQPEKKPDAEKGLYQKKRTRDLGYQEYPSYRGHHMGGHH
jgi:hypothetical protein